MAKLTDKEIVQELELTYDNIVSNYGVPRLRDPEQNEWLGPCDDSFCYATCDLPDCRWEFRRGDTPNEHRRVKLAVAKERNPNIEVLEGLIKEASK